MSRLNKDARKHIWIHLDGVNLADSALSQIEPSLSLHIINSARERMRPADPDPWTRDMLQDSEDPTFEPETLRITVLDTLVKTVGHPMP